MLSIFKSFSLSPAKRKDTQSAIDKVRDEKKVEPRKYTRYKGKKDPKNNRPLLVNRNDSELGEREFITKHMMIIENQSKIKKDVDISL